MHLLNLIWHDFIDIQSIFSDKNVSNTITKYFKNTEPPIICYKYNKPIRSTIFNYNKIVADLNIDEKTPDTWDCASLKLCYSPAGHVITGNFEIIKDKLLRSLLSKWQRHLPSLTRNDKRKFPPLKMFISQTVFKWSKQKL